MSDNDNSDKADFLIKMCDAQGVVCSTVKDGHVLIFKLSYLQDLVNKHASQEKLMIFIKRPDFDN